MPKTSKQILLKNYPSLEDFETAEKLFSQVDASINKLKRSADGLRFSAIRSNGEIFLLSQGYHFGNEDLSKKITLLNLLNRKGVIHVKIAFKKLPNNYIKPMIVKIMTQTPEAKAIYNPRIHREMQLNHLFGITPYGLIMERESTLNGINVIKSYLILDDWGDDLFDSLGFLEKKDNIFSLSPLAALDLLVQSLEIPFEIANNGMVHRDLKLDNFAVKKIENYTQYHHVFYQLKAIDVADAKEISIDRPFFSTPDEIAGTAEYLTPFLLHLTTNTPWKVSIFPSNVPLLETKLSLLIPGLILQGDPNTKALKLYIYNKFDDARFNHFQAIPLHVEQAMSYYKKHRMTFNEVNQTELVHEVLLDNESLLELLRLIEDFPTQIHEDDFLPFQYNLETDLYAATKTALIFLSYSLVYFRSSTLLLSDKLIDLLNQFQFLSGTILNSTSFHYYNPYPRFSDKERNYIHHLLQNLRAQVNQLKENDLVSSPICLAESTKTLGI